MPVKPRSRVVADALEAHYKAILLAVVATGIVLRIAVHFDLPGHNPLFTHPALDSETFLDWARRIAAGHVLGSRVFFLNPLYAYCLAPVVLVFGPTPLLAIQIVQMILGTATILLVAGATRRLLGPGTALGAALLFAVWPLLLFYEQTIMIVALAVFLNALALYLLARLPEHPGPWRYFLTGLPLGAAILARPNVALFAVLLPLWILTLAPAVRRIRFTIGRTAVLAAGAFCVVLPVTVRNFVVGHDLVFVTSSAGVNLYVSNNPKARATGQMTSPELRENPTLIESDSVLGAERATGRKMKPSEVSRFWAGKAISDAETAPVATMGFLGKKLLMFFGGYEIPSSYDYEAQRNLTTVLRRIPVSYGLWSGLMILGCLVALIRRRRAMPFALLFLAYAVGLAVFFPLAHYRAPVLPGAIPLGVLGLTTIVAPLIDGIPRRALAWTPALIVALLLSAARPLSAELGIGIFRGSTGDETVFLYNRGMQLLGIGRKDEAEHLFDRASKEDPSSWLPPMGLAALARARGELANERRHLERALTLRPGDPGALAHMARNLFDTGHQGEGLSLARKTAGRAPNDGTVLTTLAGILADSGRFEEALETYRRAEGTGLARDRILANEARCQIALGRGQDALATTERGLRLDPASPWLHYARAMALLAVGAPREEVEKEVRTGAAGGVSPPGPLRRYLEKGRH